MAPGDFTGLLKTNGATSLSINKLHRQGGKKSNRYRTVSTARSNTARVKLLGEALKLDVAGIARLKASATGQRGDTRLSYKAPTVRLTSGGAGIPDTKVNPGETEKVEIPGLGFVKISVLDDPNVNRRKDGTRIHADVIPVQVKLNLLGIQGTVEVLSLEVRKGACRRHADH